MQIYSTIEIERPDPDGLRIIELAIEAEYTPPEHGSREYGTGLPLEPDWPAEIEILSARDSAGADWWNCDQLTGTERQRVIAAAWREAREILEQAAIDRRTD